MSEIKTTKIANRKKRQGSLNLIEDWCKGCGYCINFCPTNVLEISEAYNKKGYHPPLIANPEACTLCRTCELVCPEFAIWNEFDVTVGDSKE